MEEKEIFDPKFVYIEWDDVLKWKKVLACDNLQFMRRDVNDGTGKFRCVEGNNSSSNSSDLYPFKDEHGTTWSIVYYDPNYFCKRAYVQGKVIQVRNKGSDDNWIDTSSPSWTDMYEYRVKPEDKHNLVFASNGCLSLDTENVPCILYTGTKEQCLKHATDVMCSRCLNFKTCSPDGNCRGFRELNAVKKRRWTNRELAQWVWQGNGQVKNRDGYYTLIASTAYDIRDDNKPCPDYLVVRGWNETEWHEPEVEE